MAIRYLDESQEAEAPKTRRIRYLDEPAKESAIQEAPEITQEDAQGAADELVGLSRLRQDIQNGQIPSQVASGRGGMGLPISRAAATPIARRRLIERERAARKDDLVLVDEGTDKEKVGVLGQGPLSKVATLVSELSRFPTLGAGPAAAKVLTQLGDELGVDPRIARSLAPDALRRQNPMLAEVSSLGGALPAGGAMRGLPMAKSVAGRIASNLGIGGTTLAGAGATGAVEEEGLNVSPEDIGAGAKQAVTSSVELPGGIRVPSIAVGLAAESPSIAARTSAGTSKILKEAARKDIQKALAPTTKENKAKALKLADEILTRPFSETISLTQKGLEAKSQLRKEIAGEAIDAFGELKGNISPKKVVDALEEMKAPYVVEGKVIDPQAIQRIEGVQEIFNQYGDSISKEGLRQIRRTFDKQIAESKGFFKEFNEGNILNIKKTAANEIRDILSQAEPDLAKLNKQYTFWSNLNSVISETNQRTAPQRGLIGPVAAIAGATTGTGLGGMVGNAIIFKAVADTTRSTGWKMTSARVKNNLAKALAANDEQGIIKALSEVPGFDPSTLVQVAEDSD